MKGQKVIKACFSLLCLRYFCSPAHVELMKIHSLEDNTLIIKHALKIHTKQRLLFHMQSQSHLPTSHLNFNVKTLFKQIIRCITSSPLKTKIQKTAWSACSGPISFTKERERLHASHQFLQIPFNQI